MYFSYESIIKIVVKSFSGTTIALHVCNYTDFNTALKYDASIH